MTQFFCFQTETAQTGFKFIDVKQHQISLDKAILFPNGASCSLSLFSGKMQFRIYLPLEATTHARFAVFFCPPNCNRKEILTTYPWRHNNNTVNSEYYFEGVCTLDEMPWKHYMLSDEEFTIRYDPFVTNPRHELFNDKGELLLVMIMTIDSSGPVEVQGYVLK